ncbi:MAG: SCO family protein [Pseudomonadota bacterium]
MWSPLRSRRVIIVILAVLAVLATEWSWLKGREGQLASPLEVGRLALSGDGVPMIDQVGRAVTWGGLGDRFQIVVFGYTHCPDICPTTLSNISRALDRLGDEASGIQPVFVTLDPERDRPEVLADYVGALDSRFLALTGTPEAVKAVAESYRVYFAKVGGGEDYLMDHSAYIYLVEPGGTSASYFPHDQAPDDLARSIRRALAERS